MSDQALALVSQLNRRPTLALLGRAESKLPILAALADCAEPAVIPYLLPVALAGSPAEQLAAARAVASLLSSLSPMDLIWFDAFMRGAWVYTESHGEPWRRLRKPPDGLFALASFHPSGYVREAAVQGLAQGVDGNELPYLLLRLNDWVPQVREAAQLAVRDRLRADYVDHFVQNLALVVRLGRLKRADLFEEIADLLRTPAARPALMATMSHSSGQLRRAACRLLLAEESPDLEQIITQALRSDDPTIRRWSLRRAQGALGPSRLLGLLEASCADPSAAVRSESLRALASLFPERAPLRTALLDRSPAVRAVARSYLKGVDFAQFYRDSISASNQLVAALSGLAETGVPDDAERYVAYLLHPRVRVRQVAVQGLANLGGTKYLPLIFDQVLDRSAAVSNQARKVLQPSASLLDSSLLWSRFVDSSLVHVRRNLLRLIAALPKWDSISYLIRAAGEGDPAILSMIHLYVRRWNARFNRSQTLPSAEQLERLRAALAQFDHALEPVAASLIHFAVRSASNR